MVKLFVFLKRREDMTPEEFHAYWRDTHAELALNLPEFKRHLRRYIQAHNIEWASFDFPAAHVGFDGIAEVWFEDVESMNRAFQEQRYLEVIRPDEYKFLDLDACRIMVTYEIPKYTPSESDATAPDTGRLSRSLD